MRMSWVVVLLVLGAAIFAAPVLAQEVFYVQSVKARVLSAPSFNSGALGTVAKGYRFIALEKSRNWVKVKYDVKEGYVSALLLSTRPPLEKIALIKAEDGEIKQGVRRRASTYTSAAAARGLTSDDRRRVSRDEKIDYESLEKVESLALSSEEVVIFSEGVR